MATEVNTWNGQLYMAYDVHS